MRSVIRVAVVLPLLSALLLVAAIGGAQAVAPDPLTLRGAWTLTLMTPVGATPVRATFRNHGRGTIHLGTGNLPVVYREAGGHFSASLEVPAAQSMTGAPFTMILRGTMTSANGVTGELLLLTDVPDPSSPLDVVTGTGNFTGVRVH